MLLQKFLSRKRLSRKYRSIFVSKIGPATGVTAPTTLFPLIGVEWIHLPRIRTFVEKRFHGLFSKKKLSKSGGVPSFPI